jgi:exodeoxyribonuclease X
MTDWTSLSFVVVDVEGNGQQPPDLMEPAAGPVVDGIIGEPVSWLVKPEPPIKQFAPRIHGPTNQGVADCPPFKAVEVDVLMALSYPAIVAHNAHVDPAVLQRKLTGWERQRCSTRSSWRGGWCRGLDSYRLGNLVEAFDLAEGLPEDLSPPRATYDALVAARLFVLLATKAASLEELRGQKPGGARMNLWPFPDH